jgi:acetamidase/formamidase
MFAVGDMHASMGDCEICFKGVEIAGEVDIRFDLLKGKPARVRHDRLVHHPEFGRNTVTVPDTVTARGSSRTRRAIATTIVSSATTLASAIRPPIRMSCSM